MIKYVKNEINQYLKIIIYPFKYKVKDQVNFKTYNDKS